MLRFAVSALACFIGIFACSSFESGGEPQGIDAGLEGGSNDAIAPGKCAVIFASSTGSDANSGCESAAPVKTVNAAIDHGKQHASNEIRVCRGIYEESALTLDAPISLRGGYDCVTWNPTRAETRIKRVGSDVNATTLVVSGSLITPDTQVTGLYIDGPEAGTNGIALAIRAGAKPVIKDVDVTGGATSATSTAPGAIGIDVSEGSMPEISNSRISGGVGKSNLDDTTQFGAVALRVVKATPRLHDLTVDASKVPTRAIGLLINDSVLEGPDAIERLNVSWSAADTYVAGISVNGATSRVDVGDSTVKMLVVGCTNSSKMPCAMHGIVVAGGSAHVFRNRVIGGEISTTAPGSGSASIVASGGDFVIENNFVSGGNETPGSPSATTGVVISHATTARVLYNTIDAGPSGSASGLSVSEHTQSVVIEGNIIGSRKGVALQYLRCDGSTITSFASNALIGHGTILADVLTANDGTKCVGSVSDGRSSVNEMMLPINGTGSAQNNLRFASTMTCGSGDPNCVTPATCGAMLECSQAIFAAGVPTKVTLGADGWKLRDDVTCLVAKPKSTPASATGVTDDFYSQPRSTPFSLGATETESCVP